MPPTHGKRRIQQGIKKGKEEKETEMQKMAEEEKATPDGSEQNGKSEWVSA